MITELWRLPDGPWGVRIAFRQDNWIGFYKILPDYGETIRAVPDGSVQLIADGKWIRQKITTKGSVTK